MSRVGLTGFVGLVLLGGVSEAVAQTPPAVVEQPARVDVGSGAQGAASPAASARIAAPSAPTPVGSSTSAVVPAGASGLSPGALGSGKTVTEAWVIRTLLDQNLSLQASVLGMKQSGEAVLEQEGSFPYTFQADAGYTNRRTPGLGGGNDVYVQESNSLVVGSQVSKDFAAGTSATLRVEGQRFDSERMQAATATTNDASGGAGYQAIVRGTVSQPLLSGYGSDVNEAGLRAARINQVRLKKAHLNQQSELIRDALQAYWDLWYTGRSIEIQKSALDLAILQQQEAEQRVTHGALSSADALKFQSQVATLTESYLTAQANERSQSLNLGQLVGVPSDAMDWHAVDEEPRSSGSISQSQRLARALERNPSMESLKESHRLAVDRRRTAGDQYRASLNLDAWVEAAGVGAGRILPAASQVGRLEAVSVYGGITYRTTLDSRRYSAARAQADYDVRIAEANLRIASQQIENGVAQLMLQVEQARVSAEAAERTQAIAEQQAKNERQRFALGASTPLDVQVAEDALRQAQLRVVGAKLNRKKTELALAHITGELLEKYVPSR